MTLREIGEADRADEHHARSLLAAGSTRRLKNKAAPVGVPETCLPREDGNPVPSSCRPCAGRPHERSEASLGKLPKQEICWAAMSAALDLLEEFLGAQAPRAARVIGDPSAEQMNKSI